MLSSRQHHNNCSWKHRDLKNKRVRLSSAYSESLTDDDQKILSLPLSEVVSACNTNTLSPSAVLRAYGKRALLAQDATICLSDYMFDVAENNTSNVGNPLSGVVVSIKDCIDVAGYDTTVGYSRNVNRPKDVSAPIVRLLQDAGALLHVKTTVPTGLLSLETISDIFGETKNPYNHAYSPGASTGGGAALLAYQGSMIEVGTDIGGSIRFPAAYCGLYSVKSSVGRFPAHGCEPCMPGLEYCPTVTSPIARTLDDLEGFWKRVVAMRPWNYDHTCIPLPWRPVDFVLSRRKPKWGVIWNDGIIPPSPACLRVLAESVEALRGAGHEVVNFNAPDTIQGLQAGYGLLMTDGGAHLRQQRRRGETVNSAQTYSQVLLRMPLFMKKTLAFVLRVLSRPKGRNDAWATILEGFHKKSIRQQRRLVLQKEAFQAAWHAAWQAQGIDFVLTVPHAIPPIPRGESGTASLVSASYMFTYNVLDYAAGVLPAGYVDATRDALPEGFWTSEAYLGMNDIGRNVYRLYDPHAMDGLPLAVQVVGRRLEEEKVLAGMREVEQALWEAGHGFVPRKF